LLSSLLLILCFFSTADAQQITAEGHRLSKLLDGMNVKQLWLSHRKVNWRTGEANGKPVADGKPHTHCSAFVAATAARLNIYILRPPEHSLVMLANAQADWLSAEGEKYGWHVVRTPEEAQRLANIGVLVVASYKDPNPDKTGHIAIVRPSGASIEQVRKEGPRITQAGMENYVSTSLKRGFKQHKGAWERREIRFFSHRVDWISVLDGENRMK